MLYHNTVKVAVAASLVALVTPAHALNIVTTVAPLSSLVTQVAGQQDSVELLLPANVSPHDFQLKPSQRRSIASADVVFWVGPSLESGMASVLSQSLKAHAFNEFTGHDDHAGHDDHEGHDDHKGHDDHEGHEGHDDHEGHAHDDAHPWMSVAESVEIIEFIEAELTEAAPERAAEFADNAAQAIAKLEAKAGEWRALMEGLPELRYWVFHDAYQPFENEYGIQRTGVIQANVNVNPTARQVAALRGEVGQASGCVFAEPQMDQRWIDLVVSDTPVYQGVLDPLGSQYDVDVDLHSKLLSSVVASFVSCAEWRAN